MTDGQPFGIVDPDYARVFTQARIIAWQYGYACVMHGSFTRDLDLLLVPWEAKARGNDEQLLRLIAQASGLHFHGGGCIYTAKLDWTEKPHGRKSCSLYFPAFGDGRWVDISVMPVAAPDTEQAGKLWPIASIKQEAETGLVIGDEIGMRDALQAILSQCDEHLGITTAQAAVAAQVQQVTLVTQYGVALSERITALEAALGVARRDFERLACLGNGDKHGNSVGNEIAIEAITLIDQLCKP